MFYGPIPLIDRGYFGLRINLKNYKSVVEVSQLNLQPIYYTYYMLVLFYKAIYRCQYILFHILILYIMNDLLFFYIFTYISIIKYLHNFSNFTIDKTPNITLRPTISLQYPSVLRYIISTQIYNNHFLVSYLTVIKIKKFS